MRMKMKMITLGRLLKLKHTCTSRAMIYLAESWLCNANCKSIIYLIDIPKVSGTINIAFA